MTNPPIPSSRDGLEDKLRAVISRQNDRRVDVSHRMRCLHHADPDGNCAEDGQACPCRSMKIIDGEPV
jgi:hypothetical protein